MLILINQSPPPPPSAWSLDTQHPDLQEGVGGMTDGSLARNPDPAYLWDDYAAVLPVWPHGTRHPDLQEGAGGMDRRQPGLHS
jgi:hypothetical protein